MLFGKEAWLLNYTADGELRICIPMSDVIDGQFDEGIDEGVTKFLDTGGEDTHQDFAVKMNR